MKNPASIIHERTVKFLRKRAAIWGKKYCDETGLSELYSTITKNEYPILYADQAFIYRLIMKKKPKIIVEFGSGFSTLTMAAAAHSLNNNVKIFFVETQERWANNTLSRIPENLRQYVEPVISDTEARMISGQVCHTYKKLPDVVPNFIYLDGPDCGDVEGSVNNLSFKPKPNQSVHRMPASADPLLYESTLRPGATVLIDGRHVNAQFLENMWQRNWKRKHSGAFDNTVFTLES